jgi:putative transposase
MSRYRLRPEPAQESILRHHCSHARYVWNLAVEQQSGWRPGRGHAPGYCAQAAQLTEARADRDWLAAGSQVVQQQALRDFAQAMANYFAGTHRKPTWRKEGRDEGFRIVAVKPGHIRRLSHKVGEVWIPKVGWVRFRWSRAVHGLRDSERVRLRRLQRRLAHAREGSHRRAQVKTAIARLKARERDRRKDWAEKVSTDVARRFDLIRVEDLRVTSMTRSARGTTERPGRNVRQKAGLNRSIQASGWGLLVRRLEDKAPGRMEKIPSAFTSQRCSACGHVAAESRESQALFRCTACKYAGNADVNAAKNIAAGHAVTARGRSPLGERMNREPQLLVS